MFKHCKLFCRRYLLI